MRALFVPLLMLSVLIGWTLGLVGCGLTAAQGWEPPAGYGDPLELPTMPSAVDPMGRVLIEDFSMRDPSAPDAGLPSDAAPADDVSSEPDAGRPHDAFGRCGDGTLQFGEFCDDGNTVSGDGCSALCLFE